MLASGNVQPALIDTEGLHQIRILAVNFIDDPGEFPVQSVVGRQQDQLRALLPCLPDGLRRLYPKGLGGLVFGKNDTLPALRVAAHRHRQGAEFRFGEQLHRGVKAVEVTVQDGPIHGASPFMKMWYAV